MTVEQNRRQAQSDERCEYLHDEGEYPAICQFKEKTCAKTNTCIQLKSLTNINR